MISENSSNMRYFCIKLLSLSVKFFKNAYFIQDFQLMLLLKGKDLIDDEDQAWL